MNHFKLSVALFATVLVSACGGDGSTPTPSAPLSNGSTGASNSSASSGTTSTATLTVAIPTGTASTSSSSRSVQYIGSDASQIFLDLQGSTNPTYDDTLTLDSTHCTSSGSFQTCTFKVTEPIGSDTFSIAVGGPTSNGIPTLLGYLSITTTVAAGTSTPIDAQLNAIVGPSSALSLGYGVDSNGANPGPNSSYPYLKFANTDANNTPITSPCCDNQFSQTFLLNPVTVSEDSQSGAILLATRTNPGLGSHGVDTESTPATTFTLNNLTGVDDFEIVDTLTGTQTASFNVSYSTPTVTLQDTEFPQIDSFAGAPKSWSVAGGGMKIPLTCSANTAASAGPNPCSAGVPVSFTLH